MHCFGRPSGLLKLNHLIPHIELSAIALYLLKNGKTHYKSHLKGVGAEEETKVKSPRKLTKVGVCAPKTLYHAIPTAFEE